MVNYHFLIKFRSREISINHAIQMNISKCFGNTIAISALNSIFNIRFSRLWRGIPIIKIRQLETALSQHGNTYAWKKRYMMTSSNGNIFRVTGHLSGEFTGDRWIPRTKPVTRMLPLICSWINGWINNGEAGDLRRHLVHNDATVMNFASLPNCLTHRMAR